MNLDTARLGSKRRGAIAGAISALGFAALHELLIVDIWDRGAAMVIAGALCGFCLTWSYAMLRERPSLGSWLAYNGLQLTLLFALGMVSLLVLEPTASMAGLMASSDPLGDLLPGALPLMAWASVAGSGVVWVAFGRRLAAAPSVFVTHALLVLLVGHNFAILGLVDLPNGFAALGPFIGATLFLGASFAVVQLVFAGVTVRSP